jgi:hypothetical protein
MDVVRPEHVARLLRTDDPDPVLVVVRGAPTSASTPARACRRRRPRRRPGG